MEAFKGFFLRAREMAQQLRALAALAGDPSSVPSTHSGQLTITCNSSSRGSDILIRPPQEPNSWAHTHIHKQTKPSMFPDFVIFVGHTKYPCLEL